MASPFASAYQDTVPMPGDPGSMVMIQRLSGGALERAEAAHLAGFISGRTPRGWAALFQRSISAGTATDADAAKALADPLAGYDRATIVREGLKAWPYLDGTTPKPINRVTVDDLTDDAIEKLALDIMQLTKPARFQSDEARAEERKKNYSDSSDA